MANAIYNSFKRGVLQGSYNLAGAPTLYIALMGSNYSVDIDTHAYHSDLGTEVVTPSNYTAWIIPSGYTITTNNTTEQGVLDMTDVLIANVTFGSAVNACVLFGSSGNGSASDPLYAYIDFGSNQEVTAGTFQIQWAAGGVLALT